MVNFPIFIIIADNWKGHFKIPTNIYTIIYILPQCMKNWNSLPPPLKIKITKVALQTDVYTIYQYIYYLYINVIYSLEWGSSIKLQ